MSSNTTPHRTADPWPRWPANALEWDILDWKVIKRCIAYQRYIDAHPPRPFPAQVWLDAQQEKAPVRIDTAKLPVFSLAFWQEEQRQEQARMEEEWRQAMAETHLHAFAESPFPSDTLSRRQRLEKWLDAHRGALKPWGHKKKQKPTLDTINPGWFRCQRCNEPTPEDLTYPSSKTFESKLCGSCWLEQESWVQ